MHHLRTPHLVDSKQLTPVHSLEEQVPKLAVWDEH